MPNSKPFAMVKGSMMRVTKVDACGSPLLGPLGQIVTKGFISVAFSSQVDEGNTIDVTNANGDKCIHDEAAPDFTGLGVEVALCGVDPDLVGFLSGNPTVYDDQATPQSVGFRLDTAIDLGSVYFAIETWSKVPGQLCTNGLVNYGYLLVPFIRGGTLGDFTVANDAINFTITGAKTLDGNAWGVGPYNVRRIATSGAAAPLLTAMSSTQPLHVEQVTLAPPTAVAGAQPLGTVATGATAGIPGTFTPTNSYAPANLAGMTGKTASPNTAWTTGQYVKLLDGSLAHWTGSAWAAGAA